MYTPPVLIYSQLNDARRIQNALFLQSMIPNSRVLQGINGTNAAYLFHKLNISVSPKYYRYAYNRKKSLYGKMGKIASLLDAAHVAQHYPYLIALEDDVTWEPAVFARLLREVAHLNLRKQPPILRASKFNQCLVFNGAKMKQLIEGFQKHAIDDPSDLFVMKRHLDRRLSTRCNTYKWNSTIAHSKFHARENVPIVDFNRRIKSST